MKTSTLSRQMTSSILLSTVSDLKFEYICCQVQETAFDRGSLNTSLMVRLSVAGEAFNYCAILDDYRMEEKIGEGGFGTVHLATCRENNKQYAIKYMDMT